MKITIKDTSKMMEIPFEKEDVLEIRVYDNREELVLVTDSDSYREDVADSEKIKDIWWLLKVEYGNPNQWGFATRYSNIPRIIHNGKDLQAVYYLHFDSHDVAKDLLRCLDEDFK